MPETGAMRGPATRQRVLLVVALAAIAALAWAYVVRLAGDTGDSSMAGMSLDASMSRPQAGGWTGADFGLTFAMWAVMMTAMMTPSAAPMVLTFAAVNRGRRAQSSDYVPTAVFVAGYLVVWGTFGVLAALAQWGFQRASLLSDQLATTSAVLGGALLIAAGIYQWSPLKRACLVACRTPLSFIMTEWRDGHRGAVVMGARHGLYCLGCCWALMALLFVGGVMNLLWVAAIAGFVLIEKAAPKAEPWVSRGAGLALVAWGVWTFSRAVA